MSVQLIQEHPEACLLKDLENHSAHFESSGAVLCKLSLIPVKVDIDWLLLRLSVLLKDLEGKLYLCHDGDVLIVWRGRVKKILKELTALLNKNFEREQEYYNIKELFRFYDPCAQAKELQLQLRRKLKQRQEKEAQEQEQAQAKQLQPPVAEQPAPLPRAWEVAFSDIQQQALKKALATRAVRKSPELLIVEDQEFSRKLLTGLLGRQYCCYEAPTAEAAVHFYAKYAPDVTLLDIELPDANGHALAALFRKHDPDSYIIMVTANHYISDVQTAKANQVQGFIAKPYNKQKIIGAVEAYMNQRKKA